MSVDPSIGPSSPNGYPTIPYLYACHGQDSPGVMRKKLFADSTMMQCGLRNYTYHLSFSYKNGQQRVGIDTALIDDRAFKPVRLVSGYYALTHPDLINNHINNGVDCTVLNGAINGNSLGANSDDPCSIDTTILETLSYQAIFDSFEALVVGAITRVDLDAGTTLMTSINDTILVDTPELGFVKGSSNPPTQAFDPLQQYILRSDNKIFQGLVSQDAPVSRGALKRTMESLFQNITVSMMSSAILRPNHTSYYTAPKVRVTQHNYHNVYVYSATKLWLAYGLSLGFTAIGVAVGLGAVFSNQASYNGSFSTIFRVARGAAVSVRMQDTDLDGKDPLPRSLGKAEVRLHPSAPTPSKATQ